MVDFLADVEPLKPSGTVRVATGIAGLDEATEGGYPKHSLIMLSGKCGTGRTTFGLQFLCAGAAIGEHGVFVTLEKEPPEVVAHASGYAWGVKDYFDKHTVSIVKPDMHRFDTFKKNLEDEIYRTGAKRLVIDSFSLISAYFQEDPYDVRRSIADLGRMARRLDCTTIIIEDILEGSPFLSYTGYKEFVVGGVIVLDIVKKDASTFARTLYVRKMAGTNHSLKLIPFEISSEGVTAYPDAEVF